MPVHCTEHQNAFSTKHLLWLTHAGVIPCVKTNDISRIGSENWYLKNVIEKSPKLTEIGKIVEYYRYQMQQTAKISTLFVLDLKKYPLVVDWMNSIKLKNHDKVLSFFQGGIKNGYFRKNVNFELIMEFNNMAMEKAINNGLLEKYGVQQVFRNVTMLYIRGFCTLKGIEELEKNL